MGKVWIRMGMMLSVGGTKGIKGRYDPLDGVFVFLEPVLVLGRDGCIGLWVCVVEHRVRITVLGSERFVFCVARAVRCGVIFLCIPLSDVLVVVPAWRERSSRQTLCLLCCVALPGAGDRPGRPSA